jgi:hypothetical protein
MNDDGGARMGSAAERLNAAADWMDGVSQKCCECTDGHHEQSRPFGTEDDVHVSRDTARALAAWLRWEAECTVVPEHSRKALAVADQILGISKGGT